MKPEYTKRFEEAPWLLTPMPSALIFGCGSIGSWSAVLLGRTGMPLSVFDKDLIEEVNMAGQLYRISDIGMYKSDALAQICRSLGINRLDYCITTITSETLVSEVDEDLLIESPIWVSAFDNMKARRDIFEHWKKVRTADEDCYKEDKAVKVLPILIDGRLTAETMQVFVVRSKEDMVNYEKVLFEDSEVPDLPCSFKSTSHCAAMIGAIITSLATNHIANCMYEKDVRAVPFYTEVSLPLMMFN